MMPSHEGRLVHHNGLGISLRPGRATLLSNPALSFAASGRVQRGGVRRGGIV